MEGTKSIIKEEMSRKQTIGEEISNSVSHGLGAGLSVAGLILAIIKASAKSGTIGVVSAAMVQALFCFMFSHAFITLFLKQKRQRFSEYLTIVQYLFLYLERIHLSYYAE